MGTTASTLTLEEDPDETLDTLPTQSDHCHVAKGNDSITSLHFSLIFAKFESKFFGPKDPFVHYVDIVYNGRCSSEMPITSGLIRHEGAPSATEPICGNSAQCRTQGIR